MKASKIRRRNRMFRRRRAVGKALFWLLVIPALVGGYFLAEYLFTHQNNTPAVVPPTVTTTTTTADGATSQTPDVTPPPSNGEATLAQMRAIWLPSACLQDVTAYAETLRAAEQAGYTAVVVDLKDEDGRLWYTSATAWAAEARAVQESALSMEALQTLRDTLQETYGLTLVPRLFAFRDNTAPRYLETARIAPVGEPGSVWYDDKPAEGGRRWLNPYAADAQAYILGLAKELNEGGFPSLVLDGVQFPSQESKAYYGDAGQTAKPRGDVLAEFVAAMNSTVGKDAWLLTCTATASVGEKTTVYGANPATFGAPAVAPQIFPATFGGRLTVGSESVSSPEQKPYEAATLLLTQMKARLGLMEKAPATVPWLAADSAADTKRALHETFGDAAPHILYAASGEYEFA